MQIRVLNRKTLETIQFVQATDAIPPQDFALAIVKAFSPGLSTLAFRTVQPPGAFSAEFNLGDVKDEELIARLLQGAESQLNRISDGFNCLKKNKTFIYRYLGSTGDIIGESKTQTPKTEAEENSELEKRLNYDIPDESACSISFPDAPDKYDSTVKTDFDNAKADLIAATDTETLIPLPISLLKVYDIKASHAYEACARVKQSEKDDCFTAAEKTQQTAALFDATWTKVQARQDAVKAIHDPLKSLPEQGTFLDDLASSPNHKATVKISAKDVTGTATTDIATVVVTWQGSNFGISAGILLSVLPNRAYANTPVIVNGVPTTDASGKILTMVTETDTKPSVMTPLAMFNYELPRLYCCSSKFGVLLSGGLGANLSTKSADYMAGVSFRYRDVLFTPAVHYGRENFLTNGVMVGQKLGSSPPTLPTQTYYKPALGFALTYRVPIP